MKRIIALLLTVVMLAGSASVEIAAALDHVYVTDATTGESEIDYEATVKQYLKTPFNTAEDKLASMELRVSKDGYELWVDSVTGEVATRNTETGQILFSNPYDVGCDGLKITDDIKKQLLSQIVVKYNDGTSSEDIVWYSFEQAAARGQITVKNIKNGIRVEYSIGREQSRMLVPKLVEATSFVTNVLSVFAAEINKVAVADGYTELDFQNYNYCGHDSSKRATRHMVDDSGGCEMWRLFAQFCGYYDYRTINGVLEAVSTPLKNRLPAIKEMDLYEFDTGVKQNEQAKVETLVKSYVPTYSFEQLDEDHARSQYVEKEKDPALFKMSLEYTLDEWGLSVTMPASGLRFNESLYTLKSITILPYMGAGANYCLNEKEDSFTGYNFFPDGSGALFRFEDFADSNKNESVTASIYGQDFAYNKITGSSQETVRYPVFGSVTNYYDYRDKNGNIITMTEVTDSDTGEIFHRYSAEGHGKEENRYSQSRGYVAIIEEGDALAEITTQHPNTHKYNSVQMTFKPRPTDSYNVANAISVATNATWTVVSNRKYVGNYTIRYILLTGEDQKSDIKQTKYYEASWVGMATAYREYLQSKGKLDSLTEEDVSENIPLYIETLGTLETVEKFMSIPVNVMTALTTFDDVKTMYDELSESGVSNVKFRLTGYANGGLYSKVPYSLKWEKSVGGADGFKELLEYSSDKDFEVFPEFDFVYVDSTTNTLFDGLTLRKHIVKSINNTYMSRRYYSSTYQAYIGRYELAISAACYDRFYTKLSDKLLDYYEGTGAGKTISVSTLGTDLNSDFDEDDPYNREDSKALTAKLLAKISEQFDSVMSDGANAYTWNYLDYILNVPLDSSLYNISAASVPFIGVVLHGSVQFASSPLNMEGNIAYSLLKAIENGSSINFLLCYRNYSKLKEDSVYSEYYSVRYDILKSDIVKYYTLLNDLTKDLQLSKIVGHDFLTGERIPDADEAEADKIAQEKADAEKALADAEAAAKKLASQIIEGRLNGASDAQTAIKNIDLYQDQIVENLADIAELFEAYKTVYAAYVAMKEAMPDGEFIKSEEVTEDIVLTEAQKALVEKETEGSEALAALEQKINRTFTIANNFHATEAVRAYKTRDNIIAAYKHYTENADKYSSRLVDAVTELYETYVAPLNEVIAKYDAEYKMINEALEPVIEAIGTLSKELIDPVKEVYGEEEEEETVSKYYDNTGKIVCVKYENGVTFILNFNYYDITTNFNGVDYKIESYGGVRINADGSTVQFSAKI